MTSPITATHRSRHHPDHFVEVVEETAHRVVFRTARLYARSRESFDLDYEPILPLDESEVQP